MTTTRRNTKNNNKFYKKYILINPIIYWVILFKIPQKFLEQIIDSISFFALNGVKEEVSIRSSIFKIIIVK